MFHSRYSPLTLSHVTPWTQTGHHLSSKEPVNKNNFTDIAGGPAPFINVSADVMTSQSHAFTYVRDHGGALSEKLPRVNVMPLVLKVCN